MKHWLAIGKYGLHYRVVRQRGQGQIPNGIPTTNPRLDPNFFTDMSSSVLPVVMQQITPGGATHQKPIDRLMERFGSKKNPAHFVFVEGSVNAVKGRLEDLNNPMDVARFNILVRVAVAGGGGIENPTPKKKRKPGAPDVIILSEEEAIEAFFAPLRDVSCLQRSCCKAY